MICELRSIFRYPKRSILRYLLWWKYRLIWMCL